MVNHVNETELTPAQAHVLALVAQLEPVRPDQLLENPELKIGRVMLQRHLKNLHSLGHLEKSGRVPRVFYSTVPSQETFVEKALGVVMHLSDLSKKIYARTRI